MPMPGTPACPILHTALEKAAAAALGLPRDGGSKGNLTGQRPERTIPRAGAASTFGAPVLYQCAAGAWKQPHWQGVRSDAEST